MSKDLVKKGYEDVAENYASTRNQIENIKYLDKFTSSIKKGKTILDIGCGAGKPIDEYLINKGFAVNGIDLSENMIKLARKNAPNAFYEVKDMTELKKEEYCVDGIVSFYAIFHTPREKHHDLLKLFASFMPNGGALLISMGSREYEGVEDDFHGAKMYWSHYGADKNIELVENAGFKIILNEITSGKEKHQIILANLPSIQ